MLIFIVCVNINFTCSPTLSRLGCSAFKFNETSRLRRWTDRCNCWQKIVQSNLVRFSLKNILEMPTQTEPSDKIGTIYKSAFDITFVFPQISVSYQDGRVVKALDLSSNGRVVRVGSNPTPGNNLLFNSRVKLSF